MTSIRKSINSGIFYTAIAKYSGIVISIIIGAILARLLTPQEFGIVALVTVFVSFFNLLSDFGIGPAVIQNQTLTEEDVQSIFSFSILLGIVLAVLFFLAAPFIAKFYNEPELVNISRLLSLTILFYSLQIVPKALLIKVLKFKQIGIITLSIQVFTGLISIILAFTGFSYYVLVINSILVGGISMVVFYWIAPIKITFEIKMKSIRKIILFSSFQFMFNFINYFSRNADNILIGKFMGSATLGYYDKSYRLMMMPVQNLTHVITPVLMPVLSKYQDDKEVVYNAYLKVVNILATLGFSISVFIYFTAGEIIYLLYGPQWVESIPVFKLLALTVGIQMILSSNGSIFQAINRTDLMFYSGFLSAITMVGAITYGIFISKSLEAVAYGLILAFSINFFQVYFILIHVALKQSILEFVKTLFFPAMISLIMAIILWQFEKICPEQAVYSLLSKALVAGLTFGMIFFSRKENRILLKQGLIK